MVRVVLFGIPGAGKGTQADKIEEYSGYKKISAGDLSRREIKDRTKIGRQVENVIKSGELIDDDTIIQLVKNRLEKDDIKTGYQMDGFPRTLKQAEKLSAIKVDREIVLFLNLEEDQAVKRLLSRISCGNCGAIFNTEVKPPEKPLICDQCKMKLEVRADDNAETVSHRIKVYKKHTLPVINYYKNRSNLFEIDALGAVDSIFEKIKRVL